MTRFLEQDAKIQDLERKLRQKDRTIAGIQHWLKVAGTYKADAGLADTDASVLQRQLEGMQAALLKASEYQGREQKTRGRKGK